MPSTPPITMTRIDVERLSALVAQHATGAFAAVARQLQGEMARARVVPSERVPPDLVTMNSLVVYEDERTGERREMVLVYPRDEDPARGRISILSPTGAALIGLSVGQSIDWPMPDGRTARFKVVSIVYQPEAAGDLHL